MSAQATDCGVAKKDAVVGPPTPWDDPRRYLAMMGSPWATALVRAQDVFTSATSMFWASQGVRAIHLPVTTGSVSSPMGLGSDSTPVRVDLFGVPTYLADSMQFLLEYGLRVTDSGCYYIMPSFRGEVPDETHLCQFFHSEAELPGSIEQLLPVVELYIRRLAETLLQEMPDEIRAIAGTLQHLEALLARDQAFREIQFEEAVKLLRDEPKYIRKNKTNFGEWRTLTRLGERRLMECLGEFIWVSEFDHLSVPFYQAFADSPGKARNADLMFGMGEVVGAGERHHSSTAARQALRIHQVEEEAYEWYLKMHHVMPLQTSGFGLGIERFLMWAFQHWDIRDMQLIVRVNGKADSP